MSDHTRFGHDYNNLQAANLKEQETTQPHTSLCFCSVADTAACCEFSEQGVQYPRHLFTCAHHNSTF